MPANVTLNALGNAFFNATLPAGMHTVAVVYNGSPIFQPSAVSPAATITVGAGQTTTTVQTSMSSTVYGPAVNFTATVHPVAPATGTPTGTVSFYADTTNLLGTVDLPAGSNVATLSTFTPLLVGSHTITAVYNGDSNFGGSPSPSINQSITKASHGLGPYSSSTSPVYGQSLTFTDTVSAVSPGSGTPTGTVVFKDGSTPLSGGVESYNVVGVNLVATYVTSLLNVASHSIVASYSGDSNFITSTSNTVSPDVSKDTTTTAVVSSSASNTSTFGQSVTFTATVSANTPGSGTPTGTVTFMDGTATLAGTINYSVVAGNLVATYTTSTLAVQSGGHSITVKYSGDSNFLTSTSPPITQTVNQRRHDDDPDRVAAELCRPGDRR